jgi:glycyl-tRNA synthetase beta chain
MQHDDFLVEILTEELPSKNLLKLAKAFSQQIEERLQKAELAFEEVTFFATPRRLTVFVKNLLASTPEQTVERKGPAVNAAFDENGQPSPACLGFARSCGVTPGELQKMKTPQGEWMSYIQKLPGKTVMQLLPEMIEQAALALPVAKRMRWGESDVQFVRPVHSIVMLYGAHIVDAVILGCEAGRVTRGHRFHTFDIITIPHAATYASFLETAGKVIPDFAKRREQILEQANACVEKNLAAKGKVLISSEALLEEVTSLVEWPVALLGHFDEAFLDLPSEVLISSMQDHQRYFPVMDANNQLLPYFVVISNIESHDPQRVIRGNERVLRARLSDAAFFYVDDKKESLQQRLERLKGIVFQAKLGTLYDKAERISNIAGFIAKKVNLDHEAALRTGLLAKTDLTTNMVNEFPELQGVMGGYYALHDNEASEVAAALKEHYMPRFAGDGLPASPLGQVVSLADRLDTLVGTFGINQIPTGDKDPYGLRRAALGALRILIEGQLDVDLKEVISFVADSYHVKLENAAVLKQLLQFINERARAWYQDQGISADVFMAVAALEITNPLDIHKRIQAVQTFRQLKQASTLSIANKRVSNILAKYSDKIAAKNINPDIFEHECELELAKQLDIKSQAVSKLYENRQYDQVLLQLTDLSEPIDHFFNQVMVMVEDKAQRENRLLLLIKLRALFLHVADIALLQQQNAEG